MPAKFENGRKFDSKNSLQDFDAKEKYLHPKNRPVSIQKCRKMCCLHHCPVFTRCCFKFIPVRVPFSKSTVFEICRQKMCRFRVNDGRPFRHIFHRFQNVLASCERSLRETNLIGMQPRGTNIGMQPRDIRHSASERGLAFRTCYLTHSYLTAAKNLLQINQDCASIVN